MDPSQNTPGAEASASREPDLDTTVQDACTHPFLFGSYRAVREIAGYLLTPVLLPYATAWVRKQERRILDAGVPLDPDQLIDARRLGILEPERIRLLRVKVVPLPA